MIFSVWKPDGGYDYFESSIRHGIGDDLPEVSMPSTINGIGVPAQDVGRQVPRDAVAAGSGTIPVGLMAPMARPYIGISGLDLGSDTAKASGIFFGSLVLTYLVARSFR